MKSLNMSLTALPPAFPAGTLCFDCIHTAEATPTSHSTVTHLPAFVNIIVSKDPYKVPRSPAPTKNLMTWRGTRWEVHSPVADTPGEQSLTTLCQHPLLSL